MLRREIQRNFLYLKASLQSNRQYFSLTQVYNFITNSSNSKITQFNHSRTIVNYERNTNDQNRSARKISKNLICLKYLRLIKNAIRELGPNPKVNPRLVYLIENAQKNHVSPDFINFVIRISNDIRANVGLYDMFLSNGCHFLIQYEDIDAATTKHHLLQLCERYDGNLIQDETFWPKSFEQKGMVLVRCGHSDPLADKSKQWISKLGIESYHKESDAEGVEYWKLLCDPWKLHDVKRQCEDIMNSVEEAYVGYIPKKIIAPSPHSRSSIYNVLFKLCEVPSIDNFYCNINLAYYRS